MRILVVGDSFCPVGVFGAAFERLRTEHEVTTFDIVDEPGWMARSPSEQKIREYLGSPAQVVERLAGHDVLVVQGAPITDAVLDAAPTLRLVCVARGGPVNVDVGAATERGIPVVITPGKNAQAVAELTHRLHHHARPTDAVHRTLPGGRRRACPGQLRGREVVRPRPGGPHPGRRRVRPDRTSRGGARASLSGCTSSCTTRSSRRTSSSAQAWRRSAHSPTCWPRRTWSSLHARATATTGA